MISNAPDPKAITSNLPSLKAGEFELFSPDVPDEVVQMRVRWLLSTARKPADQRVDQTADFRLSENVGRGFRAAPPTRRRVPSWRKRRPEDKIEVLLHPAAPMTRWR